MWESEMYEICMSESEMFKVFMLESEIYGQYECCVWMVVEEI